MATESSSSSSKSNSGLSRINCKKTERDQNRETELQQSSAQLCMQPNGWYKQTSANLSDIWFTGQEVQVQSLQFRKGNYELKTVDYKK